MEVNWNHKNQKICWNYWENGGMVRGGEIDIGMEEA